MLLRVGSGNDELSPGFRSVCGWRADSVPSAVHDQILTAADVMPSIRGCRTREGWYYDAV